MKRAWLVWLFFGLCAGAMLAIMAWGSRKLLQLEAAEKESRREAAFEENVRLSLWRLETALAPVIVQENSRPYAAYLDGSGSSASPYVKLHFQIEQDGRLLVPGTAPLGDLRDPVVVATLSAAVPRTWIRVEQSAGSDVRASAAAPAVPGGAPAVPASSPRTESNPPPMTQMVQQAQAQKPGIEVRQQAPLQASQSQMARNFQEFEVRGMLNSANASAPQRTAPAQSKTGTGKAVETRTGVLAPVWVADKLVLARHVQVGSHEMIQGCWIDWLKARSALLATIADLAPGSDLIPERGLFDPAEGRTLAALPLRLVPGRVQAAPEDDRSPLLFSLTVAWSCMLVAVLSVGFLLHGAISLSQRRAAFVSSVTHELRSPLTTFRMYTEMLAEGMAADPAKQSQYHRILHRESDRLVHLVENVLAYARLEKGRYRDEEAIAIGDLLDRTRERLAEHATRGDMQLAVAIDQQTVRKVVRVDVSAMERILFNLVDNACKYARSAEDRRIHLEAASDAQRVSITVRDHGPGIDRRKERRLFKPFRKTVDDSAKSASGIGIGLSLSRRLANSAGGRLMVVEAEEGACLRLELPLASDENRSTQPGRS